jgi:hypothetical protein
MIAVALGVAAPESGSTKFEQWSMWITDAQMLIEARKAELGITEPIDEAKLDYVIREAVAAHARRPDDATQVSTSVDDGSVSRTYRSSSGRIAIRDEWWTLLGLTSASGAFAVDTVGFRNAVHSDICALNFGALYCSCGAVLTNLVYPLYEGGALS